VNRGKKSWRGGWLAGMVALSLAAAGCASDQGNTDGERGAETISVEHSMGTIEVPVKPQRIVALDSQWLDALQLFDVEPVAYLDSPLAGETGLYPWQQVGDAERIEAPQDFSVPVEVVGAQRPDLILGAYAVGDPDVYGQLSEIAPTVPLLGSEQVDRWEDQVALLGRILDQEERAAELIDEAHGKVEALAQELPGLAGKTGVVAQYIFQSQQFGVVADPEDGASTLFAQLGMSLPATIVEESGSSGRLFVSPERVDVLNADLVVIWPNGGSEEQLMALPGFADLPAVTSNGLAVVDVATISALNTPSALSLDWALGKLRPQLECVAGECSAGS
jgi:iron complex transport system substrate-binding protein